MIKLSFCQLTMTEMEDGSDEGRLEAVMMVVSVRWQNGER
jgi:hypothetical protein